MKREITEYYCDLCGEKIDGNDSILFDTAVLTYYDCDDTEGRPCNPYIKVTYYDLCPNCLLKITLVKGQFQSAKLKLREHK